MIRNPLYVYGDENVYVPADIHLGRYVLDTIYGMKEDIALTNVEDGCSYTFGEVARRAVRVSLSLARAGFAAGAVAAVCSEPRIELLSTVLGILCSGGTVVSIDGVFYEDFVPQQLSLSKPTILFTSRKFYHKLQQVFESEEQIKTIIVFEDLLVHEDEQATNAMSFRQFLKESARVEDYTASPVNGMDDVALIGFTSGTTSLLKGVQLTHYTTLIHLSHYKTITKKGDRVLMVYPWSSNFSVKMVFANMCVGAHFLIAPEATTAAGSPQNDSVFYRYIEQHKINVLLPSPTMMFVAEKEKGRRDLSSLRLLLHMALPLDMHTLRKFKSLLGFKVLRKYYAMSEVGPVCSKDYTDDLDESCDLDGCTVKFRKLGQSTDCVKNEGGQGNVNCLGIVSVGHLYPGVVLKIADFQSGAALGPNLVGEICLKTRGLTKGYIGKKLELEDGWFRTGDAGCYDAHRRLYICDRVKDLIHVGGSIVSPSALEGALVRFPGIRDAAVALRDGKLTAYVQPLDGATVPEHDLQSYVENLGIEGAALSGGVRVVERIPRLRVGKVDRRALSKLQ